jgi:putative ABC transport system permease protein
MSAQFRFAVRSLVRRPILSIVALLTLALGIGANTAIFSVVNAVMLKPLPFHDPERLVMVWSTAANQSLREGFSSYPDFKDWREQSKGFTGLAAYWMFPNGDVNLTGGAEAQRVSVARITPGFFEVLGVPPLYGRTFQEEETIVGNHRRAILSYGLWRDQFGSDSTLVGRSVLVNQVPYMVVGIMPKELQARAVRILGTDVQLWRPLVPEDNQTGGRGSRRLRVVGRLAPGNGLSQAQSELVAIAQRLNETHPETNREVGVRLVPVREQVVQDSRRGLFFLLGAVAVVLVGACANVANLLLIKAAASRKQLAVQHALGASRAQLSAQVLLEALLIGGAGALLGIALAFGLVRTFVALGPTDIPLLADTRIDGAVLAFTVVATLLTALLVGLPSAWRAAHPETSAVLRQSATRVRGKEDRQLMRMLNISQIALAMVLVMTGGLLLRGFSKLAQIKPGVDAHGVLTVQLELPMASTASYPNQPQRDMFFAQLVQRLAALPSVKAATIANAPPVEEEQSQSSFQLPESGPSRVLRANLQLVGASYFGLLRIPLLQGRLFEKTDDRSTPRVVLVSSQFAKIAWGNEPPVGKRITMSGGDEAEVVGVVGDVRSRGLDVEPSRTVYMPTSQGSYNFMTVLVKTDADPAAFAPTVRKLVRELDPGLPLHHVRTLESIVTGSISQQRFQMLLVTAFSALMLVLAVIGTYGVTAYGVNERTGELGIRAALGATREDIRRLVLTEGALLAGIGILLGGAVAMAATRLLSRFVAEISSIDPVTFVLAPIVLGAAMLLAAFIPAQRAARADPMRALRSE